ncbi:MAG: glycoside hydrolase family 3 N-terminal domain-containing protein [Acidimicrobiia bacterium]|nr:glycoside hydrolase family 3 N-terminal domain-containing protein [Acidimicrobiia bacterium]
MSARNVAEILLPAFAGTSPPAEVLERVRANPPAGFTLFSLDNVRSVDQVAELTATLQEANSSDLPLLIASDQEGGQLIALRGTTDFPGNMALGAADDPELTERVGRATGTEMLAMGVNLNYAPIADLNTNPANPSLGIRAFGDDPNMVATHVAALVRGLRSAGVLATLKHFPGKGGAQVDSHFGLPVIEHSRERLDEMELVPFRAGLEAGADLVMTGHFAIPGLTERADMASTLSKAVLTGLLREDLGFGGAVVTDAFDMGAIAQGAGQVIDAIAAIRAGVDLMLLKGEAQDRLEQGLALANHRGIISDARLDDAIARTRALRRRAAVAERPGLDIVGSPEHQHLAAEAAQQSITLVMDRKGLLPLRPESTARIAAVMPEPKDLTPADTSSLVEPGLAAALRHHHADVDEYLVGHPPTDNEISSLYDKAVEYDLVVLGTISASLDPQQAALAEMMLKTGVPVIALALRTPYDVTAYPAVDTYVCTYGLRQPSLDAAAAAIFGEAPFAGRLPVAVSNDFPIGHGLTGGTS